MKVKFKNSHPQWGYFAGDEAELAESKAKKLIDEGYAVAVKQTTETATTAKGETATTATKSDSKTSKK